MSQSMVRPAWYSWPRLSRMTCQSSRFWRREGSQWVWACCWALRLRRPRARRVGWGPISRKMVAPALARAFMPAANCTGWRRCCCQWARPRVSWGGMTRPVRLLTRGMRGGWKDTWLAAALKLSSMGSTRGEWAAWEMARVWPAMPSAASWASTALTAVLSPEMTTFSGPLMAAMARRLW